MTARVAWLVAVVVACSPVSACTAPTNVQAQKIAGTMSSLPVPRGWSEPAPMQTVCMEPDLDCQDPNARRVFITTAGRQHSCVEFVGWVQNNAVFEIPSAIVGTSEKPVAAEDCLAEIAHYTRYVVTARAPHDGAGDAHWRMALTQAASGYALSVVVGSPPREPWRS